MCNPIGTFTSTGEITIWALDFGDGQTSTRQNPAHVYVDPGTYTVGLKVTGPGGDDRQTQQGAVTVVASYVVYLPLVVAQR